MLSFRPLLLLHRSAGEGHEKEDKRRRRRRSSLEKSFGFKKFFV
jgi:hypothetical protein